MVVFKFFIANVKVRSAYWHFNASLLEDVSFKDVFCHFWKSFTVEKMSFVSLQQWWDCGKVKIQQLCQQYTLNVSRDIAKTLEGLEIEVLKLQKSTEHQKWAEVLRNKKE